MKNINEIKVEKTVNEIKSKLISGMYEATSYGETENGASTFTRSGSALLDFYAQSGAMRNNVDGALDLFKKALSEDPEKAIRILFYLRDVRGGQGERKLFRVCLQYLGETFPVIFDKIVKFVPEYGRWDDIFFENETCFEVIKDQLVKDFDLESPSILAKWLPTANASSASTRAKAVAICKGLGMNIIEYRKKVRELRKKIKAVEELMSAQKWNDIEYSAVPSQASRIYRNAFRKHDEDRYNEFIEKAKSGEVKINASTLYPYQIYNSVRDDYSQTLEALWTQLPDYTQGKNALVVADVSGSMIGNPMSVSISLALYFAERNKGQFQNYFITFSGEPKLQKVKGSNLKSKMNSIINSEWGGNTNIQAVFDLILDTGIKNSVPQEEMPETIYIISDMEFDEATSSGGYWNDWKIEKQKETNFEAIKEKYSNAGYKMPNLVFWNVDARSGKNLPVQEGKNGVAMVSGFSPVIFKIAVENKTPEQVMLDTINSERYSQIKL